MAEHVVHLLLKKGQPETVCGNPWLPEPTTRVTVIRFCPVCAKGPKNA